MSFALLRFAPARLGGTVELGEAKQTKASNSQTTEQAVQRSAGGVQHEAGRRAG